MSHNYAKSEIRITIITGLMSEYRVHACGYIAAVICEASSGQREFELFGVNILIPHSGGSMGVIAPSPTDASKDSCLGLLSE